MLAVILLCDSYVHEISMCAMSARAPRRVRPETCERVSRTLYAQ